MHLSVLLFAVQSLGAFALAVGFWVAFRRFGRARWSSVAWGGLTFLVAQALRLPALTLLTFAARSTGLALDAEGEFALNLAVLSLSAGLFEEFSRYGVMRWGASHVREPREATMFGAGHGGVEAILLVGIGSLSNLLGLG